MHKKSKLYLINANTKKQNIAKRQVLSTCHLFQILYCGSQNNASIFNKNNAYAYIGYL